MPKQLRTKNVNASFCMTVRELAAWLVQQSPSQDTMSNSTPVILKCGGKNFRLAKMDVVAGKPVLVGKRGSQD